MHGQGGRPAASSPEAAAIAEAAATPEAAAIAEAAATRDRRDPRDRLP